MGEPALDHKQQSPESAVPAQAAPQAGKAPRVGSIDGPDPARDDPAIRPPEFAAMDPDCVRLLAASRETLDSFAGKPGAFWDLVTSELGAANLQALTQTVKGARAAGLLGQIQTLRRIFNHGSSWGFEFHQLLAAPAAGWGKDYPQDMVRKQHDNTAHDWYRQASGAGNPGMHLGISAGAGYTNLHWDPANPMDHVSDGTEGKNNPLLSMMPDPTKPTAHIGDALIPKGCAVYSPKALLTHADDIGWIDKNAPFLKRFVSPHAAVDGPNASTEPFFALSCARQPAEYARKLALRELDCRAQMVDQLRGTTAVTRVCGAAAAIDRLEESSRPLATEERTPANEAARVARAHDLAAAYTELYAALIQFYKHLHAEVGSSAKDFETEGEWLALHGKLYFAQDKMWAIQDERLRRKLAP